jgi:CHAD domain-containing protein/CYTH domain-containing protein
MQHPEDMLFRTPEEAARRIALSFLAEAEAAVSRLEDREDLDALHDFRVAIRRLRATAKTYRAPLDHCLGKKQRRALRSLQRATGTGRDAEVALAWLSPQRAGLREAHRKGFDALIERLERDKEKSYARAREEVRRKFAKLRPRLHARLETMLVEVHLSDSTPPPRWADELASQSRSAVDAVVASLRLVEAERETLTGVHAARIALKRLRYLLEPAVPHVRATRSTIDECKGLQDVLGDINDCDVLFDVLDETVDQAAKERAARLHELALIDDDEQIRAEVRQTERPGLDWVRRRLHERRDGLVEDLRRDWLGEGLDRFSASVHALADRFDALAERNVEVERKYLLRHLPAEARRSESKTIAQGWLPGNRLRERLRRIEGSAGTKYVRTVKTGAGVERFELEEETSSDVFDALWPLTAGCRVEKRRYDVADGDLVWEIDEFTDRQLFLAEVELPSREVVPEIPGWLADAVVEEVTGDPEYVNLNLAK